jgi:hypothetical protein
MVAVLVVMVVEQRVIVLTQDGDVGLGGGEAAAQYGLEPERVPVERQPADDFGNGHRVGTCVHE